MRSLEQNRLSVDQLLVETKRALLNANTLAHQQNTNIGIGLLFRGVFLEMGQVYAANILQRNRINEEVFAKSLILAVSAENVDKAINEEPGLTNLSKMALANARDRAKSKRTQELLPSDLLLGIAKAVNVERMAGFLNQQATAERLMLRKMGEGRTNLIVKAI